MTPRDNLLSLFNGEKNKVPFVLMGFWNEKSIHDLLPKDCWDESTYYLPSDDPPCDSFPEKRTDLHRQHAVNLAKHLGIACLGVGHGGPVPFGHGGPAELQPQVVQRTDEYKILEYEGGHHRKINFHPHAIQYYNFPVKTQDDLDKLVLPDMQDKIRFAGIAEDAAFYKTSGLMPTASIQGFFAGLHNSFMDMESVLLNLLTEPDFMHRFTKKLAEMNLQAVEMMLDCGVELVEICDDVGNKDGLLISPQLFENYFYPYYCELCRLVHSKGGWVHFHSHGNIEKMLPLFIKAGIDMINPFDRAENPHLDELLATYSNDIVFVGCLDNNSRDWSPDEQIKHYKESVDKAVSLCKKGYIFMDPGFAQDLTKQDFDKILSGIHDIIAVS